MPLINVLAHGALGYWDELAFLGVIIIFLGMMAWSWMRSRQIDEMAEAQGTSPAPDSEDPERFRLE